MKRSAPQLGLNFEEPLSARKIWPVHALVGYVRELIEIQLKDVWVEGEISNCRPASSGHIYFTLKDADAQLPVVLFRRQAMLLRFRPEDGLRVLVRGQVSVYEQRGQMQLVAETIEPVGAGSLQLAFEQLKERLKAEGLFDESRKRSLPMFPRTVGIITSQTGAVIHDFAQIVSRRFVGLNVLLFPVAVQGDSAAAEVEQALVQLNSCGLVDVIVIARGGGSLEDLAAFNSERVARAITASQLPVVSAIGHETDFTIADFAADMRAATPSAAAEIITAAQYGITAHLEVLIQRLERAAQFQFLHARQKLSSLSISKAETRMTTLLHRFEQRLDDSTLRLESAMQSHIYRHQHHMTELSSAVLRQSPYRNLDRVHHRLATSQAKLTGALERKLYTAKIRYSAADVRLGSLSPLAVLQRGYAIVQRRDGKLVRSAVQLTADENVTTQLSDGTFTSNVKTITLGKPLSK